MNKCPTCGYSEDGISRQSHAPYCKEYVAGTTHHLVGWGAADGGTANARRSDGGSAESEVRSTFAEEARALTVGPVELLNALSIVLAEVRRRQRMVERWPFLAFRIQFYHTLQASLVELCYSVETEKIEGPSVSEKAEPNRAELP